MFSFDSSCDDSSYRYKLPETLIRTTKAKGGETYIINIEDISKSLNRDEELFADFIKKQGCPTSIVKEGSKKVLKLNKIMNVEEINIYISKIRNDFVLCKTCDNPETHFIISKKELSLKCDACGNINKIIPSKESKDIVNKLEKKLLDEYKKNKKNKKTKKE